MAIRQLFQGFLMLAASQCWAQSTLDAPAGDRIGQRCISVAAAFQRTLHVANGLAACANSHAKYARSPIIAFGYAYALWSERRFREAVDVANVADRLGSSDAPVLIGIAYQFGHGVEKNDKKSFDMYMKGLERGSVRAAAFLADAYQHGRGVRRNDALAWRLANAGAERGDVNAIEKLGYLLMQGIGTPVNRPLALQFHLRAAELGSAQGAYNAALCLLNDLMNCDAPKDSSRGVALARKSADGGYPGGMRLMAEIYRNGVDTGVARSDSLAADWYRLAIAAGDELSRSRLDSLLNPPSRVAGSSTSSSCDAQCREEIEMREQMRMNALQWSYRTGQDSDAYKGQ